MYYFSQTELLVQLLAQNKTCWFRGLVCPGGLEAPCGEHGNCDDGQEGTGQCKCHPGFTGTACELCKNSHFGPNCTGAPFNAV